MQFWDIIFWLNDKKSSINKHSTKMAMIWNHLEPLVLYLLIILLLKRIPLYSTITVTIYTIVTGYYMYYNWDKINGTGPYKNSLYWEWNHGKGAFLIYSIFLFTLLVLSFENFNGVIMIFTNIIIISTFIFSYYKYNIVKSTGRFWCYFASYAPILYIFLLYFI